jgi:transcriptional regulator with XRE-family HTH domain
VENIINKVNFIGIKSEGRGYMEFGEKIQKLRNQNKWTQEQLAEKLYVSRTAVSKWESGKGYPNIDSLKDIAKLFNKTIDELLSSEEIIDIAKNENASNIKKTNNLIYGLLDVISVLFIFLPLYAQRTESFVYSVSLISTNDISNIIKVSYIVILSILSLIGIAELIMHFVDNKKMQRIINVISFIVEAISILFFAISRQTYLTAIIFSLLIIKIAIIIKNISNKKDVL